MIKISTWNINSINARIQHLIDWLKEERPDIVLLQELKCINEKFPSEIIEDLGYNIALNGQKSYNGVAILSKYPLSEIKCNFDNNPTQNEARYIEAWVNFKSSSIKVASVYVPNGQDLTSERYKIKLEFLQQLKNYYEKLLNDSEIIIIGGDFNIALAEDDVYSSEALEGQLLFSIPERKVLRQFTSIGLVDSFKIINNYHSNETNCFTWWDYRGNSFKLNLGIRIDYIFCSHKAAEIITDSFTSKNLRALTKPSDHIPVTSVFAIK